MWLPSFRAGRNVIAALVWNWGADKPVAQFSRQTAFLLQGDSPREAIVNSGPEWKVLRNDGYAPIPVLGDVVGGYYASPPGEADRRAPLSMGLDTSRLHGGWLGRGGGGPGRPCQSHAAPRKQSLRRSGRLATHAAFDPADGGDAGTGPRPFGAVRGSRPMLASCGERSDFTVVPAKTRTVILLDQGHLTNAFAVLEASGGAGGTVRLVYAEALKDAQGKKGNRTNRSQDNRRCA